MPSTIQTLAWRGFGLDCSSKKGERFAEVRLGPISIACTQQPVMSLFAAERQRSVELLIENARLRQEIERLRRGDTGTALRAAQMAEDCQ